MIFDSFEKKYEKQEREIFVLISDGFGSGEENDPFWIAHMPFLAYVDVQTNELKHGNGRLVWPITDEDKKKCDYFYRFKKEGIYCVKAHELIDKTVPEGRFPSFYNRFYVTEVLEENAVCPALEEILTEYRKPVVLQDDILGELILSKYLSLFEGWVMWFNMKINIFLDIDVNNKASWTEATKVMKQLLAEQEKWDKDMREFSANELTSLANDWQAEADEDAPAISKQDFSKRINLHSITITSGDSFSAYYDDDDMFCRHSIVVYGSIKEGLKSANMGG